MKRCAQCRGPFGLTRRRIYRFWGGPLHFCSVRCKETHEADRVRRLAEARFFSWLSHQPPQDCIKLMAQGNLADALASYRKPPRMSRPRPS
jgi:hypothetical protein